MAGIVHCSLYQYHFQIYRGYVISDLFINPQQNEGGGPVLLGGMSVTRHVDDSHCGNYNRSSLHPPLSPITQPPPPLSHTNYKCHYTIPPLSPIKSK